MRETLACLGSTDAVIGLANYSKLHEKSYHRSILFFAAARPCHEIAAIASRLNSDSLPDVYRNYLGYVACRAPSDIWTVVNFFKNANLLEGVTKLLSAATLRPAEEVSQLFEFLRHQGAEAELNKAIEYLRYSSTRRLGAYIDELQKLGDGWILSRFWEGVADLPAEQVCEKVRALYLEGRSNDVATVLALLSSKDTARHAAALHALDQVERMKRSVGRAPDQKHAEDG
ncbi:hypothetical protein ABT061_10375 [Streptosporangium sp. NPDC002544]|uniref:hypothetical protein n=1 Tax=Streptosporangium sp. NPDC002544 TaxID=3154538 RepID=UPI0033324C86